MKRWSVALMAVVFAGGAARGGDLQKDVERLVEGFDGRVGVCVRDASGLVSVRGGERFSLQSVMKLVVGAAALDAVDRREMRLDDAIVVRREDLSLNVQPIAKLVGEEGFGTTVEDLIRRAMVDSDSAAADILVGRLGGPRGVQRFLERKGIVGIRVDRDERHLQTEILGLEWQAKFVNPKLLEKAIAELTDEEREAAYRAYQQDVRDTATPVGMGEFLWALAKGELLSPSSTRFLMGVMGETVTFPDRLKAGVGAGWSIGHKTGTSGAWRGVTAATNDVGILTGPGGKKVSVVVFIGDSKASAAERAGLMAKIARAVTAGR